MSQAKPEALTPQEKRAQRVGACLSLVCSTGCQAFAYVRDRDGYSTCVCTHTQDAHAKP